MVLVQHVSKRKLGFRCHMSRRTTSREFAKHNLKYRKRRKCQYTVGQQERIPILVRYEIDTPRITKSQLWMKSILLLLV